jgi:dCMP deaminase
MKTKMKLAHMKTAYNYAACSSAVRLQVGAIIVKDDAIISIGYNGQPSGWDNICEEREWMSPDAGGWLDPDEIQENWPFVELSDLDNSYIGRYRLKTKSSVIHAEANAISKLAKLNGGGRGSAIFITHCPCLACAKTIYQAGITEVYYAESYSNTIGVDFLRECKITVEQLSV